MAVYVNLSDQPAGIPGTDVQVPAGGTVQVDEADVPDLGDPFTRLDSPAGTPAPTL